MLARPFVAATGLGLGLGLGLSLALAAPAHAGPLADALARGDAAAIAELRAQPADAGARCTLGAIYARRGDLPRAGLFLEGCDKLALPEDVAAPVGKLARATLRELDAGDLASIQVLSTPAGISAESSALPGEPFTTPATLWVKPGSYEVRAHVGGRLVGNTVTAEARKRSLVVIEVPAEKAPAAPRDHEVSFDENALDEQETAPPPDVKHPNLMAPKYRGATAMREAGQIGEVGDLVDPMAVRAAARPPRALWLGARLGGGMFDDGRAAARAGVGVAVTGRYALDALPAGAFLAVRVDWARRGGAPDMSGAALDVLGASAGAGLTVLDRGALALALIGQLRADLRLATARGGGPDRARAGAPGRPRRRGRPRARAPRDADHRGPPLRAGAHRARRTAPATARSCSRSASTGARPAARRRPRSLRVVDDEAALGIPARHAIARRDARPGEAGDELRGRARGRRVEEAGGVGEQAAQRGRGVARAELRERDRAVQLGELVAGAGSSSRKWWR